MENKLALELVKLEKTFEDGFKLNPLSFTLESNQVIGFLGQNGAGKSTLFQLLTGNLEASSGSIFLNQDAVIPENYKLKKHFGYLPQNPHLPKWVSGKEILTYAASLYKLSNIKEKVTKSLTYWDCIDFQNRPLANCSHGMQKRIGLALATIHNPEILILDEPFSGLDLFHIENLDKIIQKRKEKQVITILSTHIAPYVAKLCDKIFVLKKGNCIPVDEWLRLQFEDRIAKIKHLFFS